MKRFKAMVSLLAVAMGGCSSTYDDYYYDYAYYDSYWYGYDVYYAYTWVDPYGVYYFSAPPSSQAVDLNAAATAIASRAGTYFTPSGCVVATATGSTVDYTFNACQGAFGLRTVSGAVKLELSQSEDQLGFAATSTNLTVDGNPFILDLSGTATRADNQRSVMLTSRSRAPERTDSREEKVTITWEQGSGCVTMNGQGSSTRGSATTTTTISNYQRCVDQCPTSGTVSVDGKDGTFSGEFDGSSTFWVTAPDGTMHKYDLNCP